METVAAGVSIAGAAIIVGILLLRWYRVRQEFLLLKFSLEKGVPLLVPTQPQWLVSLRQGLLIATLGTGMVIVGAVGWTLAADVPQPPAERLTNPTTQLAEPEPPPPPPPGRGRGPEAREEPHPRPPAPPPRDPAFMKWERAQTQTAVCMSIVGGGVLLILLGGVRIAFVPAERRFANAPRNDSTNSLPE